MDSKVVIAILVVFAVLAGLYMYLQEKKPQPTVVTPIYEVPTYDAGWWWNRAPRVHYPRPPSGHHRPPVRHHRRH